MAGADVERACVVAGADVEGACVVAGADVEGGAWVLGADVEGGACGAGRSTVGDPVAVAGSADSFGWTKKAIADVPSRENITRYAYEIVYTQLLWFCM